MEDISFSRQFIAIIWNVEFFYSIFRVTAPILFAAMGSVIAEKAGVSNIGLEGMMLISAFVGVIGSAYSHNIWLGLFLGVLASALTGLFMAYFALKLKTDIILAGVAVNLMGAGGTVFFLYVLTGDRGVSSSLVSGMLPRIEIPLVKSIPVIGQVFSNHNILTYLAFISVIAVNFLISKTKPGLRIRAVGENPGAAESVGISVTRVQTTALMLSGVLAGFGGTYLSMAYLSMFSKNMTAGRGFIALAACAMGGTNPVSTMFSSLLFGFADALSNAMRSMNIPDQLIIMIPYIATIIGLVIYSINKQKSEIKRKQIK